MTAMTEQELEHERMAFNDWWVAYMHDPNIGAENFLKKDAAWKAWQERATTQPVAAPEPVAWLRQASTFGPWVECKPSDQGAIRFSAAPAPADRGQVLEEAARLCEDDDHKYETGRSCAAAIRALASTAGDAWISVQDRLPTVGEQVLVYVPNSQYGKVQIDTWDMQREAPVSFSSATIEIGHGWDNHEFEDITHWMPLLAAPLADEKEGQS
jgi:hypothetical protein